jgi:hypothetical protein
MHRSFAFLAMLLVLGPFTRTAFSQTSAHQTVTVVLEPIVSLAVHGPSLEVDASGIQDSRLEGSLHYDLTTNVRGAVLEAIIVSATSDNVGLRLEAESTYGVSEGPSTIRSGDPPAQLVTGIQPGMESAQTVSYKIQGSPDAGAVLRLTLRDPVTGIATFKETNVSVAG